MDPAVERWNYARHRPVDFFRATPRTIKWGILFGIVPPALLIWASMKTRVRAHIKVVSTRKSHSWSVVFQASLPMHKKYFHYYPYTSTQAQTSDSTSNSYNLWNVIFKCRPEETCTVYCDSVLVLRSFFFSFFFLNFILLSSMP